MAEEEKKPETMDRAALQRLYIEKRRHKRISTIIMVDLLITEKNNQLLGRACMTDLSISGMQVETKDELNSEGEFAVRFYLPNGMSFENVYAKIMRRRKESITHVYGLRFTRIPFLDRMRIWWYITTR